MLNNLLLAADSLIFDLDGTLWDASSSSALAWREVAQSRGLNIAIDGDTVRGVSGLPFEKCVEKVFGSGQENLEQIVVALDEVERKVISNRGGILYAEVPEILSLLKKRFRLYLVSNCQEWYLNAFLQNSGLGDYFLKSSCIGNPHGSKWENISEIVRENNLKNPIYIGDTHWDQEAALMAGVEFVFADYGFGSTTKPCARIQKFSHLVKVEKSSGSLK